MSSYKRKHDSHQSHEKPSKKRRPENGPSFYGGSSQDLPPLPSITLQLETAVFTHASVAVQNPDNPEMVNYERLEFLGDAQLELMASQVIFERYNSTAPGKMSTIRELLVRNETVAAFSRAYGFDKRLKIATGGEQPRDMTKIQADVFEAYVGAIVLSDSHWHQGFDTAKAWVTQLWEPRLSGLGMQIASHDIKSKETLGKQVLLSGVKLNYIEEKPAVLDKRHGTQTYFMGVYLDGWGYDNQHLGSGVGESKKSASQQAAYTALKNPLLEDIKAKRKAFLEERERKAAEEGDNGGKEIGECIAEDKTVDEKDG